jgi:hypothetical protein
VNTVQKIVLGVGVFGPGAKELKKLLRGACDEKRLLLFSAENLESTKKSTQGLFPNIAIIIWDDDDGAAIVEHIESLAPNMPWLLGINVKLRNEGLREFLVSRQRALWPAVQINIREGEILEPSAHLANIIRRHPPAGLGELRQSA